MLDIYNNKTLTRKQATAIVDSNPELLSYGFDLKYTTTGPSNGGIYQLNDAIRQANKDTIKVSLTDKEVFAENLSEAIDRLSEMQSNIGCFTNRVRKGILYNEEGIDLAHSTIADVLESDHYARMHGELGLTTTLDISVNDVISTNWINAKKQSLKDIKDSLESEFMVSTPLEINNSKYATLNEIFDDITAMFSIYSIAN